MLMVQHIISESNWELEYYYDTDGLEKLTRQYGNAGRLIWALHQKNYPAFYTALRKQQMELSFSGGSAQRAITAALSCSARALREVLLRSQMERGDEQLAEFVLKAIHLNRPEHLQALLDAGASPNRMAQLSPLAMAVYSGNMRCLQILLDHPALSTELPEDVVDLWASAENGDTLLDFCLSTVADRFLPPRESPLMPLPLPPGLTMAMAAQMRNVPMMKRLTGIYKDLNPEEATRALSTLDAEDPAFGEMASIILTACPDTLKDPYVRWELLMPILERREIPRDLEPWVEQLKGEELSLYCNSIPAPRLFGSYGLPKTWDELLRVWQQLFGSSIPLTLDRRMALPMSLYRDNNLFSPVDRPLKRAELEALLRHCPVRGAPVPGEASEFAKSLVCMASPRRLLQELQPGGLLEGEDFLKLANCPNLQADHTTQGRAKRAILLAHVQ